MTHLVLTKDHPLWMLEQHWTVTRRKRPVGTASHLATGFDT